jgi:hypothetical protein
MAEWLVATAEIDAVQHRAGNVLLCSTGRALERLAMCEP